MKYAIFAYEGIYYGSNGINNSCVIEAEDEKEAMNYALEMAQEVVESYSHYIDNEDDEIEPEYLYDIYLIQKHTDSSLTELDKEFYNDMDDFIEKYDCIKL